MKYVLESFQKPAGTVYVYGDKLCTIYLRNAQLYDTRLDAMIARHDQDWRRKYVVKKVDEKELFVARLKGC